MTKLENEISELEEKIIKINEEMLSDEVAADYVKLTELQEEIAKINNEIEMKMLEWGELEEKYNTI